MQRIRRKLPSSQDCGRSGIRPKPFFWVTAPLLAYGLYAVTYICWQRAHPVKTAPRLRLTPQSILNLSKRICSTVCPSTDPLRVQVDPEPSLFHTWAAVCLDPKDHEQLVLLFNAQTGELLQVTAAAHEHKGPILDSRTAIVQGRCWLDALWGAPSSGEWRPLTRPILKQPHQWGLNYESSGRRIYIDMDACSGALVTARLIQHSPIVR